MLKLGTIFSSPANFVSVALAWKEAQMDRSLILRGQFHKPTDFVSITIKRAINSPWANSMKIATTH
jgi:hypothetical protein